MGQWVRLPLLPCIGRSVPVQEALDIAGDIAARPRPSFTRGIGSTLDVVGMGDNRIGTQQ